MLVVVLGKIMVGGGGGGSSLMAEKRNDDVTCLIGPWIIGG